MREPQFRFRDQLEIHELFQRGVMRRANVLNGNSEFGVRSSELNWVLIQKTFDGLAFFRTAGAAVIRLELEAVENRRIVAGGDHHAADGVQMLDGKGNRRRRRRLRREDDLKIVSGKNFRRDLRETVGKKPAVVADDDFQFMFEDFGLWVLNFRFPIVRRGLRDARDICKSEILRDDRAPAVRAEFDLRHARVWQKKHQLPSAEGRCAAWIC